mgnify:CR=1 FL=1
MSTVATPSLPVDGAPPALVESAQVRALLQLRELILSGELAGGTRIAEHLNERLAADHTPVVINAASQEYFRAVDARALKARVVDCVFEDWKGGAWKVISFHAKRARGLMARHVIDHRIDAVAGLRDFSSEGYAYAPRESTADRLVFRRRLGDD